MGKKKMKLPPFLSKINTVSSSSSNSNSNSSSWSWPVYCQQPKTLSFRDNHTFKTINSCYNHHLQETPPDSFFTNTSSESASLSTAPSDEVEDCSAAANGESLENVIRGLRSERLFFEPEETSSILEQAKNTNNNNNDGETEIKFKESIILSMDSRDPYLDFKKSMEEMVEAHGLKDWEGLEELLCWYLKVNTKNNHGYIIGAFVDLMVSFAFAANNNCSTDNSSCSCFCSPSSPLSFYTSSSNFSDSSSTRCVYSLQVDRELETGINEIIEES